MEWVAADTSIIHCPDCGSRNTTLHRCSHCPFTALAEVRATSDAGKLLELVLELDDTVSTYKIGWKDGQTEQAIGLRILQH